jgi:ankyrin repeat protein
MRDSGLVDVDECFAAVPVTDKALFAAINAKQPDKLRFLLEHGANANATRPASDPALSGYTTPALFAAVWSQEIELVRLLLDHGADPNCRHARMENGMEGNIHFLHYTTPLVSAIVLKNIEMVRLLLDRGANVNTEGGKTDVPLCAAHGSLEITRLLLARPGIRINATIDVNMTWSEYEQKGYGGEPYDYQVPVTALDQATEWGLSSVKALLQQKGATETRQRWWL